MNIQETILHLAQNNTAKCYPKREEELDKTIPYFSIKKNDILRYEIIGYNHETHDNADRMKLWTHYMQTMILPNIDPNIDISGYYNIELHDSYTYLDVDKDRDYDNVLCFSKFKNDKGPVLIPDPYMICNYGGIMQSINDNEDWNKKLNKLCFFGTTTGNRNAAENERIDLCTWAIDKPFCDFKITKVAQMSPASIPNLKEIGHGHVSIVDQMKYKYHLIVDGNTCRFDVWPFKVNNVVMKYPSKEMLWYYPFLQEDFHFVEVEKSNIDNKMKFYNSNPNIALHMIYNAKKISSTLFRSITHQMYSIHLFESLAFNR